MVEIRVPALNRAEALAKGFSPDDISTWIDLLCMWLFTTEAKDCSFTTERDSDDIVVIAKYEKDPTDLLVGDIFMRSDLEFKTPMRLEQFDPYLTKPILAAWRYMQKMFLTERVSVTNLLRDFSHQLDALVHRRPWYSPDRIEARASDIVKFPIERGDANGKAPRNG